MATTHQRAIELIEQAIRIYDANSRLHDMDPGEKAQEAEAMRELKGTLRLLRGETTKETQETKGA